jgi:probable addiction module antidote protein
MLQSAIDDLLNPQCSILILVAEIQLQIFQERHCRMKAKQQKKCRRLLQGAGEYRDQRSCIERYCPTFDDEPKAADFVDLFLKDGILVHQEPHDGIVFDKHQTGYLTVACHSSKASHRKHKLPTFPTGLNVARGMTEVAREAGVSRESLYRALSADGNPEFATVLRSLP